MGRLSNIAKMIDLGKPSWLNAREQGLTHIRIHESRGNQVVDRNGHHFINMCSCSYLGLDRAEELVIGAENALHRYGTMTISTSRTRVGIELIDEVEQQLGDLFGSDAYVTPSCAAASSGLLPLLAAGCLTQNKKPLIIFDKYAHFSMQHMKASCGAETDVIVCEHNDLELLEHYCRIEKRPVVYVADGAYSMGGYAPVLELIKLQQEYGLYLYFDDSHSISAYGQYGRGFVRSQFDELNERTIIIGSLGKAFGAIGGVILFNNPTLRDYIDYFGGPLGWSQPLSIPGLGAVQASATLHKTDRLIELQNQLNANIHFFDQLIPTSEAGNGLPIRIVELEKADTAIQASAAVLKAGFYSSAVFFPIVAKDRAGLRIMMRSDLTAEDIAHFCAVINNLEEDLGV